ncbi:hypothetical protein GCM10010313_38130 [Streptomyces violarus]|uniref:Uncharacterized protein n=1 Tax=Streptomyces violarus TaxID=67380 RepID=A0A7W5F5Z0_9ACTN|nr:MULTISPECIES: hypothetical protein [Streptomyces]MBB3081286.1 hypothetical protein [Streptomyces violarus]WRU00385.1 hypothetical protein VJ737_23090 [Streptomyces sp. CGMCC 4.1772]GHD13364.1 hypothetical protein GCM10010313_38130 [Streptomyces violarus]
MTQGRVAYGLNYKVDPPAVVSGEGMPQGTSARLCRDLDSPAPDRLRSLRAFHLRAEDGTPVARVVTEQPLGTRLSGRPAVYHVLDPYGAPLGRITLRRRRAFRWGRKRWTVEPAAGPVLQGYQGRLWSWLLWWPFGLPVRLLFLIWVLMAEADDAPRPPRRITWRDGSYRAHLVFRAVAEDYHQLRHELDPRLVNALIGLHQSYDWPERAGSGGWYGI